MIIRRFKIFAVCGFLMVGLLGLYQNAAVVDFTQQSQKKGPMTAIEKAIKQSEREHSIQQKQNGVSPEQTEKKLRKKNRAPGAIGDIPFYEKNKKRKKAPAPNFHQQVPAAPAAK